MSSSSNQDPGAPWTKTTYDDREEFSRFISISLLGVTPEGPASFVPRTRSTLSDDWLTWCEETFRRVIGPDFCSAYDLGHHLKFREVAAIDFRMARSLPALSPCLVRASRPFVQGKHEMRGNPEWERYTRKMASGEAPGHLPVVFALHAVLYKLPLTSALLAYAWLEWKMGNRVVGQSVESARVSGPSPLFLEAKKQIPALINGTFGAGEASHLRAI